MTGRRTSVSREDDKYRIEVKGERAIFPLTARRLYNTASWS
jgi:hypothetical protein